MNTTDYFSLPPGEYMLGAKRRLVQKPKGCFRHYKRWTEEELLIAMDESKSDEQVAQEICRTVKSVASRRFLIRWAKAHQNVVATT